jgi:hypothetical protein
MPFDSSSYLWPRNDENFFRDRQITPLEQEGPHCVSTVLGMLAGVAPEIFQGVINTQDPSSWSDALKTYGLKLAYCPTDVRKVRFYLKELTALNDLFTISYYATLEPSDILADPREKDGWVCSSHVVIMHGNDIIDPGDGSRTEASSHVCWRKHTKRIFRVVPAGHPRGL